MIETAIVGITMGLIVIVSAFFQGRRRRVHLLRAACVGLFVATLCRGLEPAFNGPGIDLLKRYAILTAQVGVVLLILTFRKTPLSRRATWGIYLAAGAVALGELVLVWFLPVTADGEVYHQSQINEAAAHGQAWSLLTYHSLYLSAFAAATAVVAIACARAMSQRSQPFSARVPAACIFAGTLGSALFIISSIFDLFGITLLGGTENRSILLIAVVSFFFAGLALGVIRGIVITAGKVIALRLARKIVLPLWSATTTLQPDVKLPLENPSGLNQVMELSRLTIETHDALRLIRDDNDPALACVRIQHPEDPQLSAGLVRHLSGEQAVPPLGWPTLALTRISAFQLRTDETLTSSVSSLFAIRLAMNAMSEQRG